MESKPLMMVVNDVFQIEGRGTVVTGEPGPQATLAKRGITIELETPSLFTIMTSVADFEFFRDCLGDGGARPIGLSLLDIISSDRIPKGTRVHFSSDPNVD